MPAANPTEGPQSASFPSVTTGKEVCMKKKHRKYIFYQRYNALTLLLGSTINNYQMEMCLVASQVRTEMKFGYK